MTNLHIAQLPCHGLNTSPLDVIKQAAEDKIKLIITTTTVRLK